MRKILLVGLVLFLCVGMFYGYYALTGKDMNQMFCPAEVKWTVGGGTSTETAIVDEAAVEALAPEEVLKPEEAAAPEEPKPAEEAAATVETAPAEVPAPVADTAK